MFTLDMALTNGTTISLKRRERPEILFDAKTRAPQYLITGVNAAWGQAYTTMQAVVAQ